MPIIRFQTLKWPKVRFQSPILINHHIQIKFETILIMNKFILKLQERFHQLQTIKMTSHAHIEIETNKEERTKQ